MANKRTSQFLLILSKEEKEGFEQCAEDAGIGLSAWAREKLRSAAIRELRQAGRKIPFIKPIPIDTEENNEGY